MPTVPVHLHIPTNKETIAEIYEEFLSKDLSDKVPSTHKKVFIIPSPFPNQTPKIKCAAVDGFDYTDDELKLVVDGSMYSVSMIIADETEEVENTVAKEMFEEFASSVFCWKGACVLYKTNEEGDLVDIDKTPEQFVQYFRDHREEVDCIDNNSTIHIFSSANIDQGGTKMTRKEFKDIMKREKTVK